MVCIGKGVENGAVMVCERTNGQCELRGSMRHDELGDMGRFVPIGKKFIRNTIINKPHFLKIVYFNSTILNL